MPPKKGGKKGKKGGDDDALWEKPGAAAVDAPTASTSAGDASDHDDRPPAKSKSSFSGFAALSLSDDVNPLDEDDGDYGGLMSTLKAAKPKKDKKKVKHVVEDEGSDAEAAAASKKPVEVTADDLDDEWGPVKEKSKKKKGKGKKGKNIAGSDEEQPAVDEPTEPTTTAPVEANAEDEWGPIVPKKSKKAKGKKGGKAAVDSDEEQVAVDQPNEPTTTAPVEANAEDEWGPIVPQKSKKAKAKKGGKGKAVLSEDDEPTAEPTAAVEERSATSTPVIPTEAVELDGAEEETGTTKVLSKKEKEKLKKEREKAKKKAQAAAKKAAEGGEDPAPDTAPPPPAQSTPAPPNDEDEEEETPGTKTDSKKKKKKKAAKKDEEPTPAPAPSKKKAGGIGALKAMMDEKKRLEEEARRLAEEEQKRIEEEERLAAEEEAKKEAEKQRRKEKEKAKRDLAKSEGRLLTKKQKEDKAIAEIRRQALINSGVKIEGLQQQSSGSGSGAPAGKKVVYGNRKKKGPAAKSSSPVPESRPLTPEPEPVAVEEVKSERATTPASAVDDWDASSEDEPVQEAVAEGVKDSWDASSDEEDTTPPAPPPTAQKPQPSKAAPKVIEKAAANGTGTPTKPTPAVKSKAAPKAAAKQVVEEESEDESSEDESGSDSGSGSGSDSDEDSSSEDDSSSDEELTAVQIQAAKKKAEAAERRNQAREAALAARSKDNLRSPICVILGHVDTGKTKLLDKIRQTNVQEGEAGGITQQIGATYFPLDAIITKTAVLNRDGLQDYKIPGLLVIDTPGHESFTNLRSRGSSLCNIAVLVVDIMHGLEPQTLESLRLLRDRKTPFIVALNKIDRIYSWKPTPDGAFQESLAKQSPSVQREFADRVQQTIVAFAEQGLNSVLYYENKNLGRNVSLVPTSAITGEGVPDMIMLLVNLTQQRMTERLMYLSELECTVLEVKVIEGLGTTIDVVLSNGVLREGDRIVVCGLNGPIVTNVRALLTPQPLRELRIKSQYVHHKEVKAALGVKITAPELEKAIAGSRLLVVGPDDDEDDLREEVMSDLTSLLGSIDKSGRGVCVQASTLGSLEALLDFLKSSKIPVSGINIGPVHKKDVMRSATMLEKAKELACILCFDVPVDKDAERMADEMGIKLFKADIIYHLFDAFTAYNAEITEAKRKDAAPSAVWPCRLKIIAAFAKRDPIILGVDILDGTLRVGTPLAVVKTDPVTKAREIIDLGKITSLEINHKTFDIIKKNQAGGGVAIKIEHAVYQSAKMFGRHFDEKDELLSHITRASIDVLKNSFKADVTMEEWGLIKALKPRFNIS